MTLTDREHDVATLVAKGLSNREAGAELYISEKAVEYHLGNVFAKLGIRSRRQLRAGPRWVSLGSRAAGGGSWRIWRSSSMSTSPPRAA